MTHWRWHTASPAAPAFLALLRRFRLSSSVAADLHDIGCDVLAAIANSHTVILLGAPPRWLQVVRERLDDTCYPSVTELSREAAVHPVYLARQFRRWYDMSVREHLKRRRAQTAAAALSGRASTISAASHDAGFADHAHLCRVFKAMTGLTPAAYRALLALQV